MLAIIPMTAIVPIPCLSALSPPTVGEGNAQSAGARDFHLPVPVDRQLGVDHDEQRDGRGGHQRGEKSAPTCRTVKGFLLRGAGASGSGAPLASMLWGCIAIFAIINKQLRGAVAAAGGAAGAVWRDPRPGGGALPKAVR